jgi:hypothetical protein
LLKLAATYASYELRAAARRFAQVARPTTATAFFEGLREQLDDQIKAGMPFRLVKSPSVMPHPTQPHIADALPTYDKVLAFQRDRPIDFEPTFRSKLASIFNDQRQNEGAHYCVHQLGYGYINGAIGAAGFLREGPDTGMWLAADYSLEADWPSVKVKCVNNGETAVGTTALDMARMLSLLHDKKLFDGPAACQDMLDLIVGSSWFDEKIWPPTTSPQWMTHAKVGEVKLDAGGLVMSEGGLLHSNTGPGGDFAVVWVNLKNASNAQFRAVAAMIKAAVDAFLAP